MARNASCGISTLPTFFMRFLPSFCFSRSLRLRRDVAAVALGGHVLAHRAHGLARDRSCEPIAAWIATSYCWRGTISLQLLGELRGRSVIRLVAVHDGAERVERLAVDQHVELAPACSAR